MKVNISMAINKIGSLKEGPNLVKNKEGDKKDIKVKINNTVLLKAQANLKKEKTNLIKKKIKPASEFICISKKSKNIRNEKIREEKTINSEESVSKRKGFCSSIMSSNLDKELIGKNSIIKDMKKSHKIGRLNKIFNYILVNIFILIVSIKNIQSIICSHGSNVTLKVNSKGNSYIFHHVGCSPPPPMPNEIYINGIKQTEIKSNYAFSESKNEIQLIWENNINTGLCFFSSCPDISEINLTNLDTSQITSMWSMFYGCSSLISLDLSHFNILKVSNIMTMFSGCSSLEYIDLENAIIKTSLYSDIFDGISEKVVVCSKDTKWKELLKGFDIYINCINSANNNFEYKCFKKSLDTPYYKHICSKCGKDYHQKNNDSNNNKTYINCFEHLNGYYLDINDSLFKQCYLSCDKCDKEGNQTHHNCLECKADYQFEINVDNYKNCYNTSIKEELSTIANIENELSTKNEFSTNNYNYYYNYSDNITNISEKTYQINIKDKYINDIIENKTNEEDISKNIIGDITSGALNEEIRK